MFKLMNALTLLCLLPGCFSPRAIYYELHFKRLNETLIRLEHTERKPFCARQIQNEIAWLYAERANELTRIASRLNDLQEALEYPEKMPKEDSQNLETGLYGMCFQESFFALQSTALKVKQLADSGLTPPLRLKFLDELNSADKIKLKLSSLKPGTREFEMSRTAYRTLIEQNVEKDPVFSTALRNQFRLWDKAQLPEERSL
jgi:hypothetical protein